ncbi:DUF4855 domain-containing protein [Paenibacillus sp. chi10]|uniref:DUF4855 domain-containing protein n=1 Tax=Paenibacillus suaedae TaxID=3077233 RepID=A0AAJ2JZN5_9BACL|nr:DUF4855 domain-containing protein [Paenibacillus sp. chi10]MDT8977424.1 DUF4855 domain-containing protein [Paenibacillus sp. chi10]
MIKLKRVVSFVAASIMLLSTFQAALAVDIEPTVATDGMRNLASGISYSFTHQPPDENYPDDGTKLTDGKYGDANDFMDPNWTALLKGKTREIIFDLGESKSIGKIKSHFLYNHEVGIYTPEIVSYYASEDGMNWAPVKYMNSPVPLWTNIPTAAYDYVWDAAVDRVPHPSSQAKKIYARYVKIAVTTEIWVFMDEVEIWGVEGKTADAYALRPVTPSYLKPGNDTAGIHDLWLMYNSMYSNDRGNWTKEKLIPYVSYVDNNGEPQDWMYDGTLLLGIRTADYQRDFGINAVLDDWKWYLDKMFKPGGDLSELNAAVTEAGNKLNDSHHKMKVVIMIPNPGETISNFGDVDGDGISENFVPSDVGAEQSFTNRKKAVYWYLDQVRTKWMKGRYDRLELVGMYWMAESMGRDNSSDEKLVKYAGDIVHKRGQKLFWVPNFGGNRNYAARAIGFDATALQPNHYWGGTNPDRIEDAAYLAKHHGLGIEMEMDEDAFTNDASRDYYIDYLNGGVDFGYMNEAFMAYYQGVDALLDSSRSSDPRIRELYDWMYQFVKGTYQKQPR